MKIIRVAKVGDRFVAEPKYFGPTVWGATANEAVSKLAKNYFPNGRLLETAVAKRGEWEVRVKEG